MDSSTYYLSTQCGKLIAVDRKTFNKLWDRPCKLDDKGRVMVHCVLKNGTNYKFRSIAHYMHGGHGCIIVEHLNGPLDYRRESLNVRYPKAERRRELREQRRIEDEAFEAAGEDCTFYLTTRCGKLVRVDRDIFKQFSYNRCELTDYGYVLISNGRRMKAGKRTGQKLVFLHRVVMGAEGEQSVHHRGSKLDCRREMLLVYADFKTHQQAEHPEQLTRRKAA